jgi:hypothetical protein
MSALIDAHTLQKRNAPLGSLLRVLSHNLYFHFSHTGKIVAKTQSAFPALAYEELDDVRTASQRRHESQRPDGGALRGRQSKWQFFNSLDIFYFDRADDEG